MLTLLQSQIEDFTNSPQQLQNHLADTYVKFFVTAWFWPYYVMGNLDDWQKLGITLNGARPIKC
jgi:hypothetical protein